MVVGISSNARVATLPNCMTNQIQIEIQTQLLAWHIYWSSKHHRTYCIDSTKNFYSWYWLVLVLVVVVVVFLLLNIVVVDPVTSLCHVITSVMIHDSWSSFLLVLVVSIL